MGLAVSESDIRRLMTAEPFIALYGFELRALGDGECTIEMPFDERFNRPGGVVSGPVYMAAADAAMWFALMTRYGQSEMWVTADMTTAFLRAAERENFRCTARVLKASARSAYGVAECVGTTGELLTHHTLTYLRAR